MSSTGAAPSWEGLGLCGHTGRSPHGALGRCSPSEAKPHGARAQTSLRRAGGPGWPGAHSPSLRFQENMAWGRHWNTRQAPRRKLVSQSRQRRCPESRADFRLAHTPQQARGRRRSPAAWTLGLATGPVMGRRPHLRPAAPAPQPRARAASKPAGCHRADLRGAAARAVRGHGELGGPWLRAAVGGLSPSNSQPDGVRTPSSAARLCHGSPCHRQRPPRPAAGQCQWGHRADPAHPAFTPWPGV